MYKLFKLLCLFTIILMTTTACVHTQHIRNQSMDFDQGIKMLARDIADQLETSNIENILDKAVINPITHQKQRKKIVIDPFIDVESGYPVKANTVIKDLISKEIGKRFNVIGIMGPENLGASKYILNGMVTLEDKMGEQEKVYKVFATVFDKITGKVLASASVYFNNFDTTPMDIYKDSPVFLKGINYDGHVSAVRTKTDSTVNKGYSDRLATKSMLVKGDMLYEKHEYKKSLAYYNQVAGGQNDQDFEVLNGQYTNLIKQKQLTEAELTYAKLLKKSILETNQIATKIYFAPNSIVPLESNINHYNIYIRQIAILVTDTPSYRIQIIGHCSRSGSESYNVKLSLQRAEWIQNQMIAYAPTIKHKSETIGRGFKENKVGSGKDDITDAIDRRVEFKFIQSDIAENYNKTTRKDVDNLLNVPIHKTFKPLDVDDIEYYLKNKVSSKLVASRIAERGVNFEMNNKIKNRLIKLNADEHIFLAIVKANARAKKNK